MTTYAQLQADVANYLDDDGLSSEIVGFIRIAESRHRREIRMREMLVREPLAVAGRNVALPEGFLEAINLRLLTSPVTVLSEISIHEMTVARQEDPGKPSAYCITSDFEFDRAPDSAYSGEISYYKALTPLSDDAPSNVLLATYPDAYLYAALSASAPFQMADERLAVWEAMYRDARDAINAQANASRRVGPLVSRVHGLNP